MADPYFLRFPALAYDIAKDDNRTYVRNLFRTFRIRPEVIANKGAYYAFDIPDWETPESLAEKIYGSVHLYWIFFQMNITTNPFWDWPMQQRTFSKYLSDKYQGDALYVSALTGQYTVGETLTGATSGATGVVVSTDTTNWNTGSQTIPHAKVLISSPVGTFVSETITGTTSGKTSTFQRKQLNTDADHHFEDADGNRVDAVASGAASVSNRTYEDETNEAHRSINVLRPEYTSEIIAEFESILE
jgi:hypothetical protein